MNLRKTLFAVNAVLLALFGALVLWPQPSPNDQTSVAAQQTDATDHVRGDIKAVPIPTISRSLFGLRALLPEQPEVAQQQAVVKPQDSPRLLGIMQADGRSVAVVESPSAKLVSRLRVGDRLDNWLLISIAPRSIEMRGSDRTAIFTLDRGRDPPPPRGPM